MAPLCGSIVGESSLSELSCVTIKCCRLHTGFSHRCDTFDNISLSYSFDQPFKVTQLEVWGLGWHELAEPEEFVSLLDKY